MVQKGMYSHWPVCKTEVWRSHLLIGHLLSTLNLICRVDYCNLQQEKAQLDSRLSTEQQISQFQPDPDSFTA